jgi:hypothetical protein
MLPKSGACPVVVPEKSCGIEGTAPAVGAVLEVEIRK